MANVSTAQPSPPRTPAPRTSTREIIRMIVGPGLWLGLLFAGAGRFDWLRGWICVILFVINGVAVRSIAGHFNPSLIEARRTWLHKDAKASDRILVMALVPLMLCQPLVAGLDAVRFHWSSIPFAFMYLGIALYVLAMGVITWAISINPFAESTVRIQSEREHRVITSGPYRAVRHPLYASMVVVFIAVSLILGSAWALALTGLVAVFLIVRTALEDRTLRRELPGYEEYSQRTRYRLLPGVW